VENNKDSIMSIVVESENIIKVEDCEFLGKSFSGSVYRLPYESAESLFKENKGDFSASGMKSFLSAMAIPTGFFGDRNQVLQRDIVEDTKNSASEKKGASHFLVLVIDNTIQYVCPDFGSWESPEEELCLDTNIWNASSFDASSGYVKYVAFLDKPVSGEFNPCIYVRIPILYAKPIIFDLGAYKPTYFSGLVDCYSSASFRMDSFSRNNFMPFTRLLLSNEKIREHVLSYSNILDVCSDKAIKGDKESLEDLVEDLKGQKTCSIPKGILAKIKRHAKLMQKAKTPGTSPKSVSNLLDILNVAVYYIGFSEKPLTTKHNMEKKVFKHFKDVAEGKDLESELESPEGAKISFLKIFEQLV